MMCASATDQWKSKCIRKADPGRVVSPAAAQDRAAGETLSRHTAGAAAPDPLAIRWRAP
jgi:hypothetical protein